MRRAVEKLDQKMAVPSSYEECHSEIDKTLYTLFEYRKYKISSKNHQEVLIQMKERSY